MRKQQYQVVVFYRYSSRMQTKRIAQLQLGVLGLCIEEPSSIDTSLFFLWTRMYTYIFVPSSHSSQSRYPQGPLLPVEAHCHVVLPSLLSFLLSFFLSFHEPINQSINQINNLASSTPSLQDEADSVDIRRSLSCDKCQGLTASCAIAKEKTTIIGVQEYVRCRTKLCLISMTSK